MTMTSFYPPKPSTTHPGIVDRGPSMIDRRTSPTLKDRVRPHSRIKARRTHKSN